MEPLSRKIRSRVLWVLLFIFVVFTPVLIGYSSGYRIDDALGIIKTGGIYIHSNIANTTVYLDDEFVENNGTLLRNTLIESLLPNRYYSVRVEHSEYQSWVKVLKVQPKFVTEAQILMLPKEFEWEIVEATTTVTLKGEVGGVEFESEEVVDNPEYEELDKLFINEKNQFDVEVATSSYEYIRGVRYPTTTTIIETQFPEWFDDAASTTELMKMEMVREKEGIITWLDNGVVFATWGRVNDTVPYYFCIETCKEQLAIHWEEPIIRYQFYPNRNDVLIVLNADGIYAVELDNRSQRNIQIILEEPNLDFRIDSDDNLIVFDGEHFRITNW